MDNVNSSSLGSLQFLTGPLAGQVVQLSKPITSIGRGPSNDIVVSDPSVSREHAQIIWSGSVWSVRKLAQQNTLLLNQREITQSPLTERDTITLGKGTTFVFTAAAQSQSNAARTERASSENILGAVNTPPVFNAQQGGVAQASFPSVQSTPQQPVHLNPYGGSSNPSMGQYSASTVAQPSHGGQEFSDSTQRVQSGQFDGGPAFSGGSNVPSLEMSTNTDHDKEVFPLPNGQGVFDIGRDPTNTIVLNRPTVSAFHAQIIREGNQLVLVHPHPKRGKTLNGVSYNGQNIAGDQPFRAPLKRGDVIRISDANGTFVSLTFNDGSGQVQDVIPELPPVQLGAPVLTLGRSADNNVVLNHPQVSSHHARLELIQGGYRIVDLRSTNHVFVNAQRVSNQVLKPGDIIKIGPFKLTYTGTVLTQQDESYGIRIDALHLKKKGNNNVVLVNDISFAIPPRKFVALVGGSGAGKSTLMDTLNGLRPAQEGTVLYNGQDYYRNLESFSTQLGYVPQDDIIHRDISVERALYYAAKLRLPQDFTEKQIKERIDEVLEDVEMKHRRKLPVSKLSGGQRKRVSIALELLANPSVFFLDEPTSGLDPGLDRKMMLLLRKLADKGHTIVLVTHATNNINACDYICFLCQGGKLAYFGPPNDAKTYFGKTDFAEIYSALEPTEENPNIPTQAEERFRQSPDYQRYVVDPLQRGPAGQSSAAQQHAQVKQPPPGNPWKQFWLLSMRYLELLFNDRVNLAILLLQAPIIGLILLALTSSGAFAPQNIVNCPHRENPITNQGKLLYDCGHVQELLNTPQGQQAVAQQGKDAKKVFNDFIRYGSGGDAQKTLFIMAFAAVMFGCINGAREIVKEAAIYRRERAVNLGIAPYLASKIAVLGAFSLVQSFILVLLVNFKAPFEHGTILPGFVEIYITMALTALGGLMTGLLVSAIVPNNDRAMSLVPLPLIPQVIFAGVVFSLDNPSFLQIPGAFFTARWAMAAMGSSVGLHGDKLGTDAFSYQGTLFPAFNETGQPGATFHLLLCWAVLVLMIFVQGALIAWFLKRKDVRR